MKFQVFVNDEPVGGAWNTFRCAKDDADALAADGTKQVSVCRRMYTQRSIFAPEGWTALYVRNVGAFDRHLPTPTASLDITLHAAPAEGGDEPKAARGVEHATSQQVAS